MSFFNLPGILRDDAGLQGACFGSIGRCKVGDFPVKGSGYESVVISTASCPTPINSSRFGRHSPGPTPIRCRNRKALQSAGLQQLAGTDKAFDNFAVTGASRGPPRWIDTGFLAHRFRIVHTERPQSIRRRLKVGVCLRPVRFRLLQVGFGDGAVGKRSCARA